MTPRRKVLVAVSTTIAIAGAGIGWAAFAPRLPGRGTTSNPIFVAWDQAVATVSNDPLQGGDPTTPGLSPTRNGHIGVTDLPTFDGKALVVAQRDYYAGYRATVGATAKTTPSSLLVQRWVLTDDTSVAGSTRFTPGVELTVAMDPADCGLDMSTATAAQRELLVDIEILTEPASDTTVYAYKLESELVPAAQHQSANCNVW